MRVGRCSSEARGQSAQSVPQLIHVPILLEEAKAASNATHLQKKSTDSAEETHIERKKSTEEEEHISKQETAMTERVIVGYQKRGTVT